METTIKNRNESYHKVDKETRRQQVKRTLSKLGRATNRQIAEHMNQPINRITGRMNELRNSGQVEIDGKVFDQVTNRTVTVFKIVK